MNVLVTGGAGFIGSHLVLELLREAVGVVILDDLSTGVQESVPNGVELVRGDGCNYDLVANILSSRQIEAVFHLAAKTSAPESVSDPLTYYRINTEMTRVVLSAAVANGVRYLVFSSSAAVYGRPHHNPVSERTTPNPISPYGTSKLVSEWMIRDVGTAHELKWITLRYFNVAGADPALRTGSRHPNSSSLIKAAVQVALGRRPRLEIFGADYETPDGTGVRDFIHVADLVSAHSAALQYLRDGGQSQVLNCGYGRGNSVLEVVDAVKRISGRDVPVEISSRRPGDAAEVIAEAKMIRRRLNWQPSYDHLDTIVAHELAWEGRELSNELFSEGH